MHDLSHEDASAAVDAVIAELLAASGWGAPPVDALRLAQEHLGMEVCVDRRLRNRGRAQRVAGRPLIYLRPEPSPERHQWTVAHEIGEHLRPGLLRRLGISRSAAPAMLGEALANLLAFRLLVPQQWFAADAPAVGFDLLTLKERYVTASHEVIALRLLDLPAPCTVTIVDNGRVTQRKSNAWPAGRTLLPQERECRDFVNRRAQRITVERDGWAVTGWPVHKHDWKREVLRSVCAE